MKYNVMYIEEKSGVAALEANIGQVFFSKSGKTLEYKGRKFKSLKGSGFKANYFDTETGEHYWFSNCRKDGNDGLYRTKVFVDEEVRREYWGDIRKMPERIEQAHFISTGKHKPNGQEIKSKRTNV
ncbi:hypothetical protein HCH_03727 [Hahella chejuensis KCTC 2396]|uniref:1-deoxy-D-xylulose-5-phosphate synthase n=1 Tax=Hahella chejuensis (strain KCTC 2396) TaxID=349521 RepID=Q2SFW2_HAHCH|nr:hypothetical protein [Hahella chejuensis]ABC30462.1 hypothetical protein HCH_03727 [Hahella chejuensis KCTC 2396]